MLSLLCVSFRDAERGDGLGWPLRLGSVGRRTVTKGSHKYWDGVVPPLKHGRR